MILAILTVFNRLTVFSTSKTKNRGAQALRALYPSHKVRQGGIIEDTGRTPDGLMGTLGGS